MKLELRKLFDAGVGGSGGMAKDFDYSQIETALTSIEKNISNIMNALSTKIRVTSYSGDAQPEVEQAVDSIRTYLATMEEPLSKMKSKIDEVRNAYAKSEAGIKASLAGIAGNVNA